jgi:hypothetical protein
MMSFATRRLCLLVAAAGLFAFAGSLSPGAEGGAVLAQPEETPIPEGPVPCDPNGTRTISPQKVEEGGEVEVRVEFNFTCTGEDRKVNFFFVVENTSALRGTANRLLNNVKDGLQRFTNQVNYVGGSRGGLVVFADEDSFRVTLSGGNDGKQRLLNAISALSVEPSGNSAGAPAAVREATGSLPTGSEQEPNTTNVIVFVDAGAPVLSPPLLNMGTACGAAREAGVHVIVIGLSAAGNRNGGCATPGWVRTSGFEDGRDFPEIMDSIANDLLKGLIAREYEFADEKRHDFAYIAGSGQPEEPDINPFGDLTWRWNGVAPPGGHVLTYRIQIPEGAAAQPYLNSVQFISIRAALWLSFGTGIPTRAYALPNPQVCIYARGNPGFCDDKLITPTVSPPPPTETETPDVTPTATSTSEIVTPTEQPSDTDEPPTATATPTGEGPLSKIYLPLSRSG